MCKNILPKNTITSHHKNLTFFHKIKYNLQLIIGILKN